MFRIPFFWPDSSILLNAPWAELPPLVRYGLVALLVVVPLALLILLYTYELRLIPRFTALLLLGLRLCVYGLVLFLVCAQPTYARDTRYTLPGRVVVVIDRSASMDVA